MSVDVRRCSHWSLLTGNKTDTDTHSLRHAAYRREPTSTRRISRPRDAPPGDLWLSWLLASRTHGQKPRTQTFRSVASDKRVLISCFSRSLIPMRPPDVYVPALPYLVAVPGARQPGPARSEVLAFVDVGECTVGECMLASVGECTVAELIRT